LIVTDVPASSFGSGAPCAVAVVEARLVPKIETIAPGEIGWAYEAAFTTPPGSNCGIA
jgi:hypothetical protein